MATDTLERTEQVPDTETSKQPPEVFHYVKKGAIAESAVEGTHVVALCGETFPVTKAAKPGSPVCPECKRVYQQLRP